MKKPSNSKVIIIPKTPQNQTGETAPEAPVVATEVPAEAPAEQPAQPEDPKDKKN